MGGGYSGAEEGISTVWPGGVLTHLLEYSFCSLLAIGCGCLMVEVGNGKVQKGRGWFCELGRSMLIHIDLGRSLSLLGM